jgi:hypothetical protein
MNQNTLKYLALGILVGYLSPYLITLIKKPTLPSQPATQETEEEQEDD